MNPEALKAKLLLRKDGEYYVILNDGSSAVGQSILLKLQVFDLQVRKSRKTSLTIINPLGLKFGCFINRNKITANTPYP